jgi:FkbM family methyltransferase
MALTEQQRIALAAACSDADAIPKVAGAGEVFEEGGQSFQRMHNGLKIVADAYYGAFMTAIIAKLKGHHEPQEEKVFRAVLETLAPRPTMVELGGYWAYYSMWLLKERPEAAAYIVEPIPERLAVGKRNLAANGLSATLIEAAIGNADRPADMFKNGAAVAFVPTRSLSSIFLEHGIGVVDILHMDVQGWERLALDGARELLEAHRIRWVFVSTHRYLEEGARMDLHEACLELLKSCGYSCVAEHTPEQSFSVDGLIVAKAPGVAGPDYVPISLCTEEHLR